MSFRGFLIGAWLLGAAYERPGVYKEKPEDPKMVELRSEIINELNAQNYDGLAKHVDLKDPVKLNALLRMNAANGFHAGAITYLLNKGANPMDDRFTETYNNTLNGKGHKNPPVYWHAHVPHMAPIELAMSEADTPTMNLKPQPDKFRIMYEHLENNPQIFKNFDTEYKIKLLERAARGSSKDMTIINYLTDKLEETLSPADFQRAKGRALQASLTDSYRTAHNTEFMLSKGAQPSGLKAKQIEQLYGFIEMDRNPGPVSPETRKGFIDNIRNGNWAWSQNEKDLFVDIAARNIDPEMIKAAIEIGGNPVSRNGAALSSVFISPKLQSFLPEHMKKVADALMDSPHMKNPQNLQNARTAFKIVDGIDPKDENPETQDTVTSTRSVMLRMLESAQREMAAAPELHTVPDPKLRNPSF